ncbi:hypothetical protein [Nocardia australiensis]|nr:hypothetical protein [Nocardia australiensis]
MPELDGQRRALYDTEGRHPEVPCPTHHPGRADRASNTLIATDSDGH